MAAPEKLERYDQLRSDVDGVYEVATATNKTVQGIAAVQAMHGKRLDDLQVGMNIALGQLDQMVGKQDRLERVQRAQGTKLDGLAETVEQHTGILREHSKRFDQLDNKIDNVSDRLNTQIDTVAERLDMKIDKVEAKIDKVAGQLDARIDKVDTKIDKVLALLTADKA